LARAKRTDRTEARRRFRAQQTADFEGAEDGEELVDRADDAPSTPTRRARSGREARSTGAASAAPRPARPSFIGSARMAYHQANVREDLALLPRLLLHWSVILSAALALGGTILLLAASSAGDGTSSSGLTAVGYAGSLLVSLFVGPPPFGAALLMGFMVPRGSYLVGAVFGAFASSCLTLYVLAQPSDKLVGLAPEQLIYAWVLGVVGTAFFSAGMAWYKRFLDLLNPNRGQRGRPQKPQQGRGNAPRNRLSGSSR
jgi:hypothetical protein